MVRHWLLRAAVALALLDGGTTLATAQATNYGPAPILGGQTTIPVSGTSARVALPASNQQYQTLTIYNPNAFDAWFALGGSTVTAAASGLCVNFTTIGPSCLLKANTKIVLQVGTDANTYIAGITGGSSGSLVIYQGNASQQLSSLGGSGGGGSGTVTSVGLALPNIFTVSGSPVTTST